MSFHRFKALAALAMLLALGSCKVDTINNFPPNPASLRYAAFMPDAPFVDVQVQGVETFSNVPFQQLTAYQQFDNVQTAVAVLLPNATTPLASNSASLSATAAYTLVGYGTTSNPQLLFQVDDVPNIGSGNTQLRFTDLGYGFPNIAVYITEPGVPLDNLVPTYGLGYGANTSFQRLVAGPYQIRITVLGGTNLLYDSGPIELAVDASQGIYLFGVTATHSFTAQLAAVVGGTNKPLPNQIAALKTVNAAYGEPNLDLQADGVAVTTNLPYNSSSVSYTGIVAGARTITFSATAAPTVPIAQGVFTFEGSTDSTTLISGPNTDLRVTTFADFNTPPAGNVARIRVINASPDGGAFDVAVDDVVVATNVQYTNASPYFNVTSGNHTIKLLATGTTTPIATIDNRAFGGQAVFSIYQTGPASALMQYITQDNV